MSKILYIPVVRDKFDYQKAEEIFENVKNFLLKLSKQIIIPSKSIGDIPTLKEFLNANQAQNFTGIIFHNTTFTDAEFIQTVHQYYPEVPILLLAPREPSIGERLKLNALTGIISSANYLKTHDHDFQQVYGNPDEQHVKEVISRFIKACTLKSALASLKIGVVGTFPPGFFFSDANAGLLKRTFGVTLRHYDIDRAFEAAEKLPLEAYQAELAYALSKFDDLDPQAKETIKYVKYVALMKKWAKRDGWQALASRCWPDFFDKYHCAPGAVWSQLSDQLLPTAMECDIHGALSMFILQQTTNNSQPVFLGDLSSMDQKDNTITMWHDYGAFSLANPKYGVKSSVHPNRKIPVSPQFVLKPGEVSIFRVHFNPSFGYEFIIVRGNVLDTPAQFNGVSAKVQLDLPVNNFIDNFILNGYESHFALVYGDHISELIALAKLLKLPLKVY
ncbi:hypothetical protein [Liquorilactobacillus sicerae]|uniref:hypothetical protein n=1 Tax=Liquorilactobacillus sicerae TaxID=1416943 RepID=UPI002481423B|nr:hypothetical protein [Liquorilactobacillus sicerae]